MTLIDNRFSDADLKAVSGLDPRYYIDHHHFVAEKKTIFQDRWCSVGFEYQIPESGDLLPIDFCGHPLVLVRGEDRQVRVFHNACPHRGTQLVSEKCSRKLIVCPYHSWSFRLAGRLHRAPHYEDANPENFSLREVRSHVWAGTIFINLSGEAKKFQEVIAPLLQRWSKYDFDLLRFGGALDYEFESNWKLIVENFLECYHVPSVHPNLARYSKFSDRYPIHFADEYIGQGSRRYKPNAINEELPRWPDVCGNDEFQAEYVAMFPNTLIGRTPDHVFIWSLDPLQPDRTIERLRFFFIGDQAMQSRYEAEREACLARWKEVNDEDFDIVQRLFKGHKSPGFGGAKFAPNHEETIYAFHKLVDHSLLSAVR